MAKGAKSARLSLHGQWLLGAAELEISTSSRGLLPMGTGPGSPSPTLMGSSRTTTLDRLGMVWHGQVFLVNFIDVAYVR
jgi:hypothetical protein